MNYKRFVSCILTCILVLMTLSSCSSTKANKEFTLNEINYVSDSDPWYDLIRLSADDIAASNINLKTIITHEDSFTISLHGYSWSDLSYEDVINIYEYSFDGELLSTIDVIEQIGVPNSSSNVIDGYSLNGDDYFLIRNSSYEDYSQTDKIYKANYALGTLEFVEDVTLPEGVAPNSTIQNIQVTEEYMIYYILDSELNYYFYTINLNDNSENLYTVEFGSDDYMMIDWCNTDLPVASGDYIYLYVYRSMDDAIYSFDPQSGIFNEVRVVNPEDHHPRIINSDGTFLYQANDKIIMADIATGNDIETVVDLSFSAVSPSSYNDSIACFADGNVVMWGTKGTAIIKSADSNPHAGKQIVTVAYLGNLDNAIDYIFEANNGSYESRYYLKLVFDYNAYRLLDYGEFESVSEAYGIVNDMLIRDINTGTGPDVVFGGACCSSASPELIFADISQLINLNRDEYLPIVFNSYEDGGAIFSVPYSVSLNGIAMEQNAQCSEEFTFDNYIDFVNNWHRGRDIFRELSDMEYFEMLFSVSLNDYMSDGRFNITSGQAGDEFRTMAEFVGGRDSNYDSANSDTSIKADMITAYSFYSYLCNIDRDLLTVTGIPSYSGMGAYTNLDCTISITGCCADKEAAWSIVEQLFSYDAQVTLSYDIPVNLEALNVVIDMSIEGVSNGSMYVEWYTPTTDLALYKTAFLESVTGISNFSNADPKIIHIIYEELPAYYEEQKAIEDVALIIENRVNNYLDEVA